MRYDWHAVMDRLAFVANATTNMRANAMASIRYIMLQIACANAMTSMCANVMASMRYCHD